MELAPIVLFAYNRVEPLQKTIQALQKNYLAEDSVLFIYSDGPKKDKDKDKDKVSQVRSFVKTIGGFKKVITNEAEVNKGLAISVIDGVTEIIQQYGKVIVLEDDLLTSANFLTFMNQALNVYQGNLKTFSIAGYTSPVKVPGNYPHDVYFTRRASSWGWATWEDRWMGIDWEVADYNEFTNDRSAKKRFNEMGSDMVHMLARHKKGEIDSWAIRWCYHQYKNDLLTVVPVSSKVSNIGFGALATHTNEKFNRFTTTLDLGSQTQFAFNKNLELDKRFVKQFVERFSLNTRAYYKILNFIWSSK